MMMMMMVTRVRMRMMMVRRSRRTATTTTMTTILVTFLMMVMIMMMMIMSSIMNIWIIFATLVVFLMNLKPTCERILARRCGEHREPAAGAPGAPNPGGGAQGSHCDDRGDL